MMRLLVGTLLVLSLLTSGGARAEAPMTGLARLDPERSKIRDFGGNLQVVLALSQPVPWRVFTLDEPRRLVLDFATVDWGGTDPAALVESDRVSAIRAGDLREGWSRAVLRLAEPLRIETAGLMTGTVGTNGQAILKVQLAPTDPESFAEEAGVPEAGGEVFSLPEAQNLPAPRPRRRGDRPLRVMLDPGHGGIDPGAVADGQKEAELMLTFAQELAVVLRAAGMEVMLTRAADLFVPLETRVSLTHRAAADVFISLHADALAAGRASGATVYTLSNEASDAASRKLAARHDRDELLAGIDLSGHDDEIAGVLMDMARVETAPRSEALADALVAGLAESIGDLHERPRLSAGFSVLKSADIPSVLVELGFLSNPADRAQLDDAAWRAKAARGIRDALREWAAADADAAELLRQ